MKTLLLPLAVLVLGGVVILATPQQTAVPAPPGPMAQAPAPQDEQHFRNIRQLTFGGQNAEAYFSADGTKLIFQSNRDPLKCDQIFIVNTDGTDQHMVSTGKGRTTCSYLDRK